MDVNSSIMSCGDVCLPRSHEHTGTEVGMTNHLLTQASFWLKYSPVSL